MTTLSRQIAESQRDAVQPPAGKATAGKGAAAPVQPVPAAGQPARLEVNVTHTAAAQPGWVEAYKTARSASWLFIFFLIAIWIGSKVAS